MKLTHLTWILCFGVIVFLAGHAGAQDEAKLLTVKQARDAVYRAMTQGVHPLRPDLTKAQVKRMKVEETKKHANGQCFEFVLHSKLGRLQLRVDIERRKGRLLYVYQGDREFTVRHWKDDGSARTDAEVAEEIEGRSVFSAKDLEARARKVLRQLYSDCAKRKFRLVKQSVDGSGPIRHDFHFVEEPPRGVFAVYRNRADLAFSAETGDLVSGVTSQVRYEVREAPRVSRQRAVKIALAHLGLPETTQVRTEFFIYLPRPETLAVAWCVGVRDPAAFAAISPSTGEVLRSEKPGR